MKNKRQPASTTANGNSQVRDILATVEAQLAQLRTIQKTQEQDGACIEERERTVIAQEQAIARDREEVASAQSSLTAERAALEGLRRDLDEQRTSWNASREAGEAEDKSTQAKLEQRTAALDQRAANLEERAKKIEVAEAEVHAARASLTRLREECDELTMEKARLEQQLSEEKADLERAVSELNEQFTAVRSKNQSLEHENAALITRADESRRAYEARTTGHDEATEAVRKLTQRVDELSAALDATSNQSDSAMAECLELVQAAEHERDAAKKQIEALRERMARNESSENESTVLAERLQEELASVRAEVEKHEQTIAEQIVQLEHLTDPNATTAQLEAQTAEIASLQSELESARSETAELQEKLASGEGGAAAEADLDDLRRKAQRLATVADHLRRRQARLRRVRTLIKQGSKRPPRQAPARVSTNSAAGQTHEKMMLERRVAQQRNIDEQRRQLLEARQLLALAERKMVRRWAQPRAIITIGWFTILSVVAAAVGWFSADRWFPATVAVAVTIEADAPGSGPLSADVEADWKAWHSSILDGSFTNTLSKRMLERHLAGYGTDETVRARIEQDLRVDDVEPETVTFTLAGTDREVMLSFMDIFASTLVSESAREMGEAGRPQAKVRGAFEDEKGRRRYAQVNTAAISDDRLRYAAPIAGLVFAVMLLFIGITYTKLSRAKREFDSDGEIFTDLARQAA